MTTAKPKRNALTRKLGPLPLYLWLLLALGSWFLYTRLSLGSSSSDADTGTSDASNGQDLATAGEIPVGGGGASGDALHRALQGNSSLDPSSWDDGGWWDDSTYPYDDVGVAAPLAEKHSALTGASYITYADSSQPFAYGSAPEQRPSDDPRFGRSFYEGSINVPMSSPAPASNRPTPQPVAPAPVSHSTAITSAAYQNVKQKSNPGGGGL